MQFEEDIFLPIYLRHYLKYFSPENIFVIDHGSSKNIIPQGINRIYIPRDRPFSEKSRLELIKKVSDGLLEYYDFGVYSDCDELISFEGVNDQALMSREVTYVAGFEVFSAHTDRDSRLLGLLNPCECKPLIFTKTPAWTAGFHCSGAIPDAITIPLVHIRYLDRASARDRLKSRQKVYESLDPHEKGLMVDYHWSLGERELNDFYQHLGGINWSETRLLAFQSVEFGRLFNINPVGFRGPANEHLFSPKGDWKLFKNDFWDLSTYFPALISKA